MWCARQHGRTRHSGGSPDSPERPALREFRSGEGAALIAPEHANAAERYASGVAGLPSDDPGSLSSPTRTI